MTLQVFNPKFVERVWKARRAAIEPSKPTISDIVAEYRRNRRRCAAQQHRQRGSKPPAAKPERYQAAPDFPGRVDRVTAEALKALSLS